MMVLLLTVSSHVWASHPLITDDSGTQGKGKFQLEVNGQYDSDKETDAGTTVRTTGGQLGGALSYGLIDTADVILGVPYQWVRVRTDGIVDSRERGVSDTTLEVKWRFYEKSGASFALKPGVSLPTGNDEKGLGSGKVGYSVFFISSWDANPWELHINLGYRRNENTVDVDEVKDIWHASMAAAYKVVDDLKVVANIGVERNPNKASDRDPAFALGGIIYAVNENFDVDFGVKAGLNRAETDYSFLAGTAFRF